MPAPDGVTNVSYACLTASRAPSASSPYRGLKERFHCPDRAIDFEVVAGRLTTNAAA